MTRIVCAEDCGNSPRKLLIKKFLTAMAKGEAAFVLKNLAEGVIWDRVGVKRHQGGDAVASMLRESARQPVSLMSIENIITHGPTGAASGIMSLDSGRSFAFSHVYRFKSAADSHIQHLTEFLIET